MRSNIGAISRGEEVVLEKGSMLEGLAKHYKLPTGDVGIKNSRMKKKEKQILDVLISGLKRGLPSFYNGQEAGKKISLSLHICDASDDRGGGESPEGGTVDFKSQRGERNKVHSPPINKRGKGRF